MWGRSVVIVGDMTAHLSCPNMAAAETLDSDDDENKDLNAAAELSSPIRIITDR